MKPAPVSDIQNSLFEIWTSKWNAIPYLRSDLNKKALYNSFYKMLGESVLKAQKNQSLEIYRTKYGIQSVVLYYPNDKGFFGIPKDFMLFMHNSKNTKSKNWMKSAINSFKNHFNESIKSFIWSADKDLLSFLYDQGFYIEYLDLVGQPKTALSKLKVKYNPPANLNTFNLRLKRIETRVELNKIIDLERQYFKSHPEFAWFGGNEKYLKYLKKQLWEKKNKRNTLLRLIYNEDEIIGKFECDIRKNHSLYGDTGGMDLFLTPRFQGLGISKSIYRIALEYLISKNVRCFSGHTSQKPVIKMGKVMDRKIAGYDLGWGTPPFNRSHFRY